VITIDVNCQIILILQCLIKASFRLC